MGKHGTMARAELRGYGQIMIDDDVAKVAILTLVGMLESRGVLPRSAFADRLHENADRLHDMSDLAKAIHDFANSMENHAPKLSLIEGGLG